MKYFLLIILLLLAGCSQPEVNLGGPLDNAINSKLSTISTAQESYKTVDGKYRYVAPETIGDLTYTINEYETAKGEVGYQVVITRRVDVQELSATTSKMETVTKTLTKSVGFGVLAEESTFDWR